MTIRQLPVPTRLFGGESLISYAARHSARNGTTIENIENALQQAGTMPRTKARSDPRRLEVWRLLGALDHRAFTVPATIDGAAVIERPLCLPCTDGHGGTGRLPRVGWVCTKHKRWIGPTQTDIHALPELLAAERHYRRVLAPRGSFVRSPIMELARDCALVGTSRNLIASRERRARAGNRELLVYPETVKIAKLTTAPSYNARILCPDLTESDRIALTARQLGEIFPACEDSEPSRAAHRIAKVFNTIARGHAKRIRYGRQHEPFAPIPRAWATW